MDRLDAIHDQGVADTVEGAEDHHVTNELRRQCDFRIVRIEEPPRAAFGVIGFVNDMIARMIDAEGLAVADAVFRAARERDVGCRSSERGSCAYAGDAGEATLRLLVSLYLSCHDLSARSW